MFQSKNFKNREFFSSKVNTSIFKRSEQIALFYVKSQWFNFAFALSRKKFVVFFGRTDDTQSKKVCNGGVACSLLKLGSLKKTIIASLFHSGLHSGTIFCGKNDVICYTYWGMTGYAVFWQKKDQKILCCQIDFLIISNFFWSNHFLIRCQTKVLL